MQQGFGYSGVPDQNTGAGGSYMNTNPNNNNMMMGGQGGMNSTQPYYNGTTNNGVGNNNFQPYSPNGANSNSNPALNSNNNSTNNNAAMGGLGGALGGALGSGFAGAAAQNVLLDIGKQNLEQYIKVGEQSFLTNYLPFVRDLRQYFKVDHHYVGRKTALLFAPFLQKTIIKGSALADGPGRGSLLVFRNNSGSNGNSNSGRASTASLLGGGGGSPTPTAIRSASSTVGGVNTQFNFGEDSGFGNTATASSSAAGGSFSNAINVQSPNFNNNNGVAGSPTTANGGAQQQFQPIRMPAPIDDGLAPDLYIPSMALLTYVALCGFIRGLTNEALQPEFLAAMLWSIVLWEAFEVLCVMVASYVLITPIATLDALSLAGYKHVGVCALLLLREVLGLAGSFFYLVPVLYVAACSVLFAHNTIRMFIAHRSSDGAVHVRSLPLLYGWAGVQALFVFWFAMKPF